MPLSWNEIRSRALAFSKEWANETSEDAEAKAFWDAFFNVFGITRRRVASFEEPVKKSDGAGGYIDLLWRGTLLVEHKSRGKDLNRATKQAFDYFPGLKERDLPRYVVVSDFARFRLHDLDAGTEQEFDLADLHKNVKLFGFMAGYQSRTFGKEAAVNIRAAEKLGKLHDLLKASGYEGHQLEVLLVRLLFLLFAEDTGIFERRQFTDWIEQRTSDDGADLGSLLNTSFEVLDTPPAKRQKSLDEQLAGFPYVNGKLFSENLRSASFDRAMRETLLDCAALDWSQISPAIFGSLFQSIMDAKARRDLGAHYTSEHNIRKALGPLFLDDLWAELEKLKASGKSNAKRLLEFHTKLAGINVLDPACGCGNFLVVAYQELRLIELDLLREMHKHKETGFLDVGSIMFVDVDQFHGIEYEEFPAQIAQVALWLTDHAMNMRVSEEFGQYFVRLPLKKAANIVHGNALTVDWASVIAPASLSYIVGNPPFRGAKFLSNSQRAEVTAVFAGVKGAGVLDYVAAWHRKATDYMAANPNIRTAFVSTNSITQGEQVGALWSDLLSRGVKIHFAHRTFQWSSEARGKAAVHCVIVGFGLQDRAGKIIFDYDTPQSEPHIIKATNINPYLVEGSDVVLSNRSKPICAVPSIGIGNKPIDGGHYLFKDDEKAAFILSEPESAPYFRKWLGSDEFINGFHRWCLWLGDCPPDQLKRMPECLKRVQAVRDFRLASTSAPTKKLAATPTRFHVENFPKGPFLVIPEVSSEKRQFIPIGYMQPETICSNLVKIIPDATLFDFGILTSTMHMAWMRAVCGRLESRYRYSAGIVYNNFPWPSPTAPQRTAIEQAAQAVLDARALFPTSTLADLYDPLTTPPELTAAHRKLDRAVDVAYGKPSGFPTEAERVAFLFKLYEAATARVESTACKTGDPPDDRIEASSENLPSGSVRTGRSRT